MTDERRELSFSVNAEEVALEVPVRMSLADCLRDMIGLTGTHLGCEQGICGSCTVLVDGVSVRSCLMLAVQADGTEVRTVEGLADGDTLSPLQCSLAAHDALQCGFCTPGVLMTGTEILATGSLSAEEIERLLSGNLCRCTGYRGIVAACREVYQASAGKGAHGAPATETHPSDQEVGEA